MPLSHTVQPGDSVASIAARYFFLPEKIWNHSSNGDLKKRRSDPNALLPGDVVVVPDPIPKTVSKPVDMRHRFRVKIAKAVFRLQLLRGDKPWADQPWKLSGAGKPQSGATTKDGVVEASVPPTARMAKLEVGKDKDVLRLDVRFGEAHPASEPSGVQRRLGNLGFPCGSVDGSPSPQFTRALIAFQWRCGLKQSGEADQQTIDRIAAIHDRLGDFGKLPDDPPPPSFPVLSTHNKPDPGAEADEIPVFYASLQSPKLSPADGANTYSPVPPTTYYVIVGTGTAAIVNHATLRQVEARADTADKDKRIGKLPVIHVGHGDLWGTAIDAEMGQPAHLLALPGFKRQPSGGPTEFLRVSAFAATLQGELDDLRQAYGPIGPYTYWAGAVQARGDEGRSPEDYSGAAPWNDLPKRERLNDPWSAPAAKYRILVIDPDGKADLIYAAKVDLCTGPGVPNLFRDTAVPDDLKKEFYGEPWVPPERSPKQKRLIAGQHFMISGQSAATGKALFTGGGPTSPWCMDRALGAGLKAAVWSDVGTFDGAFVPSGRNERYRVVREEQGVAKNYPADARVSFAENYQVGNVRGSAVVDADLNPVSGKVGRRASHDRDPQTGEDQFKEETGKTYQGKYEQVVAGQGQTGDAETRGTPAYVVKTLGSSSGVLGEDGRLIGMQLRSGDIRVIGAAIVKYPNANPNALKALEKYERQLPKAAQAAKMGISVVAAGIAAANNFFNDNNSNNNVNTATLETLQKIIGDPNDALAISEARGATVFGIPSQGILEDLLVAAKIPKNKWDNIAKSLRFIYAMRSTEYLKQSAK